ncbi:hypothetical protein [Roseateles noduli]|uniref:hypothetical protein n=1 Tax=Roseateles noduli TaxID=2052484 RepID=UPI003D65D825
MAVKLHYATQENTIYPASRFDVCFGISGTLSLGLQSVLYLDACLKGESGTWADAIVNIIRDKLWGFWEEAISKDITYSIGLHNHKGKARIFEWECLGAASTPSYREVKEFEGLLFSVHGDGATAVREQILSEVGACSYCDVRLEEVLAFAAIRVLQSSIMDDSKPYIGGQVQACLLERHVAEFLVCSGNFRYLRSAYIEDNEAHQYRVLNLSHPWLDQMKSLAQLVNEFPNAPPLISGPLRT